MRAMPSPSKRQKVDHVFSELRAREDTASGSHLQKFEPASLRNRKFPTVSEAFLRKPEELDSNGINQNPEAANPVFQPTNPPSILQTNHELTSKGSEIKLPDRQFSPLIGQTKDKGHQQLPGVRSPVPQRYTENRSHGYDHNELQNYPTNLRQNQGISVQKHSPEQNQQNLAQSFRFEGNLLEEREGQRNYLNEPTPDMQKHSLGPNMPNSSHFGGQANSNSPQQNLLEQIDNNQGEPLKATGVFNDLPDDFLGMNESFTPDFDPIEEAIKKASQAKINPPLQQKPAGHFTQNYPQNHVRSNQPNLLSDYSQQGPNRQNLHSTHKPSNLRPQGHPNLNHQNLGKNLPINFNNPGPRQTGFLNSSWQDSGRPSNSGNGVLGNRGEVNINPKSAYNHNPQREANLNGPSGVFERHNLNNGSASNNRARNSFDGQGAQRNSRYSGGPEENLRNSGSSGKSTQSGGQMQAQANPMQQRPNFVMSGSVRLSGDGFIDLEIPYHDGLRQALSRRKDVAWIQKSRIWRTSLQEYEDVLEDLQKVPGVQLCMEELHDLPRKLLKVSRGRNDESQRYEKIPENLQTSLMEFQRIGVKFALKKGTRVLIGDEMGLGKTVQAIALLSAYKDKWPAIIITPASLREQWGDALHQWLGVTESRMMIIHSGKDVDLVKHIFDPKSKKPSRDFLIVSYNFLNKLSEICDAMRFKIAVLDESHSIKDPGAQRTKATVPVVQKAEHAILLSGTPMINRPKELLSQISALMPEAKLKQKEFGERYCLSSNPNPRWPGKQYDGCCNEEELNKLLTSTIMIRRLKKDVLKQLPDKRRQKVILRLDQSDKEKLSAQNSAMSAARSMADSGSVSPDQRRLVMELYRLTAQIKVKAVQAKVEEFLESDQKFLIFCHHKVMNDSIAEILNKKHVKHICIDGSVDTKKRQGLVEKFQLHHDVQVALLSIQAAGVGYTLTASSQVIFAEYAWGPGEIQQAEDRAHRLGQTNKVNIYFLHVKGSIDDIMWNIVQTKLGNVGQAINGQKESFDLEQPSEQRAANQGSLRNYLSTETQLRNESDSECLILDDGSGLKRPTPHLAIDHKESSMAHKMSNKQSNLKSFFQPGSRDKSGFPNDDWD